MARTRIQKPWRAHGYVDGTWHELDVFIDYDVLAHRLAKQALRNASGKASQMHGAIKARIVKKGGAK